MIYVVVAPTPRGPAGPRRAARLAVAVVCCVACALPLAARGQGLETAAGAKGALEIGVHGQVVAAAWNPLRVTLRDAPATVLEVRMDEGSLREGERIVAYRARLEGGSGVSVFDDDVYVPRFRSLSWTLVAAGRVLASGSVGAREADARPLDLVVSTAPGRWRSAFAEDARPVDVAAGDLPERPAAYDGVRSVLVDGSSAAPRPEALAAAASGGAVVLLAGAMPPTYQGLDLLAPSPASRLAAGAIVRTEADPGSVRTALRSVRVPDRSAVAGALAGATSARPPAPLGQPLLLAFAAGFALAILLLVRFAGVPGLMAAVALVLVTSLAGWRLLRPAAPQIRAVNDVWLGGGDLALGIDVRQVLTLPEAEVLVPVAARALEPAPYTVDDAGTHARLARWHSLTFASKPRLRAAELRFVGPVLRNDGAAGMTDVYVVGLGPQAALAGGASLRPARTEDAPVAPLYERLAAALPDGSALARGGGSVWIALPLTLSDAAGGEPR